MELIAYLQAFEKTLHVEYFIQNYRIWIIGKKYLLFFFYVLKNHDFYHSKNIWYKSKISVYFIKDNAFMQDSFKTKVDLGLNVTILGQFFIL